MKYAFLTVCSLFTLCACGSGSVKDTLGISRSAPDEFRVLSRPPLSVPPQFTLRPPSNSDESPTAIPADKQAQSLVLGKPAAKPGAGTNDGSTFTLKQGTANTAVVPVTTGTPQTLGDTASESQFLKNVGADKADPGVRDMLVEQKIRKEQEEPGWWELISTLPEKKETLVDAKGEAERIRQNQDAGKPITEGDTPEAKDKDRGVLGRILGW